MRPWTEPAADGSWVGMKEPVNDSVTGSRPSMVIVMVPPRLNPDRGRGSGNVTWSGVATTAEPSVVWAGISGGPIYSGQGVASVISRVIVTPASEMVVTSMSIGRVSSAPVPVQVYVPSMAVGSIGAG